MPSSKYTLLYIVTGVLLTAVLTACEWNTVYNHYEHTPIAGWEKNDTLNFVVGPLKDGGDYVEEVGVRISGDYPFTGLNLIVEQLLMPSHEKPTFCKTTVNVEPFPNSEYSVSSPPIRMASILQMFALTRLHLLI